ncbi:MAG: nitroreductase family protein [Actinomycetota bacterium]
MDTLEAIFSRRSIPNVEDRRPDRSLIEKLLEAAVQAPNHHLTEPWRFVVLTGGALDRLGEAMAERVKAQYAADPNLSQRVQLELSRPRRAPVILTVVYVPSDNPKAIEVEDRYALGAAIENVLLAAQALGLGAYLRTGPAAEFEGVKRFLGLSEGEEIAGFIYLGYPAADGEAPAPKRTAASERTVWLGWDQE